MCWVQLHCKFRISIGGYQEVVGEVYLTKERHQCKIKLGNACLNTHGQLAGTCLAWCNFATRATCAGPTSHLVVSETPPEELSPTTYLPDRNHFLNALAKQVSTSGER